MTVGAGWEAGDAVEAGAGACWEDGGRVVLMPPLEVAAEAGAEVVAVAVIVERAAQPTIEAAGLDYFYAYNLPDLGL